MLRTPRLRSLQAPSSRRPWPLLAATLGVALAASACMDLGGLGGLGGVGFDPVDEDFSRPSPLLESQGALQQACEEDPAVPMPQLQVREQVFDHALCLCGDLDEVGEGLVARSRSQLMGADGGRGHVGINGAVQVVGNFDVDGTLDVAQGLQGVGSVVVGQDLLSGADVEITGDWAVGRDAWIDGDLQGVGTMSIGRDLYLSGDLNAVGSVDYNIGHRGFAYRSAPCPCGAGQLVDVAAEVAAHRTANDNATLPGGVGEVDLVLETGTYYFATAQDVVGARSITVRGHASVYLDGDLETVGDLGIVLEERAELELWVAGTVRTVGNLSFLADGDTRPRAFRLFMGGAGESLVNVGNATFVGAIYAPQVDIEYVGSLQVNGSLFANSIRGTGNLEVIYDTDLVVPQPCADDKYKL